MADESTTPEPKPKDPTKPKSLFRFQVLKGEEDEEGRVLCYLPVGTVVQRVDDKMKEHILTEPWHAGIPEVYLWRPLQEWEKEVDEDNGDEEEG
jgi:hypothetical protein